MASQVRAYGSTHAVPILGVTHGCSHGPWSGQGGDQLVAALLHFSSLLFFLFTSLRFSSLLFPPFLPSLVVRKLHTREAGCLAIPPALVAYSHTFPAAFNYVLSGGRLL